MVYMHFPQHLTEEEEILQKKYAKLKKKKKALAALRAPKQEPQSQESEQKGNKRSTERAADATEQAKKLLKSGVIKLAVEKKDSFKRSKRQKETVDKSSVGFQPFSPSLSSEDQEEPEIPGTATDKKPGGKIKGLYESFITPKDRNQRAEIEREREDRRDAPQKGNTIYIHGHGITEDLLQKHFSNFGKILNLNTEKEKNCCFVTYEKMESADQAISEMNGSMVAEIQLRVSMARRQPHFEAGLDPSSTSWASIAASTSQKGSSHKDQRELISYDADDIF